MTRTLEIGDDFDVRLADKRRGREQNEADKTLDAYRSEELASLHLKCGSLQFHTQSSEIACALDIGTPISTAETSARNTMPDQTTEVSESAQELERIMRAKLSYCFADPSGRRGVHS